MRTPASTKILPGVKHSLTSKPLVSIVLGTRPEAIKLAPVIISFQQCTKLRTRIITTGEHRTTVSEIMKLFKINPNKDLGLNVGKQSFTDITSTILQELTEDFRIHPPDLVLVQGNTTTALASALTAFYAEIPVGHIEAGLSTHNLSASFPGETNRCLIAQITNLHFAPTVQSAAYLRAAGVKGRIHITGNTTADSILLMAHNSTICPIDGLDWNRYKVILVKVYGRENLSSSFKEISSALLKLLEIHPNIALLLPLHQNPIVRKSIKDALGYHPRAFLIEPLTYDKWITVMRNCTLILTDSGSIQEEATILSKPTLILRNSTERLEAIETGIPRLIETKPIDIIQGISKLLQTYKPHDSILQSYNLFGAGEASSRILAASCAFLNL